MVIYLWNSHPERWRDRPWETSATTNKRWCQFRQKPQMRRFWKMRWIVS